MNFVKPDSPRGIIYYVLIVIAFVLLIIDLAGDGAQAGNIGVFVLIGVAEFVRPGGLAGRRG